MVEFLFEFFDVDFPLENFDFLFSFKVFELHLHLLPVFVHDLFDFNLLELSQMLNFCLKSLVFEPKSVNLAFGLNFQRVNLEVS